MAVLITDIRALAPFGAGDISNPDPEARIYSFLAEGAADVASLPVKAENPYVAAGSTAVCGANGKRYYLSSTDEWTEISTSEAAAAEE